MVNLKSHKSALIWLCSVKKYKGTKKLSAVTSWHFWRENPKWVRNEARNALKREWYCKATCSVWSEPQGEATALYIWRCVCPGHGDAACRSLMSLSSPHRLSTHHSAEASQAWCDPGILLDKSFLEVLSFFSIPILYKLDFNQKRKDILHVLPPEAAFLLGKTGTSMLVHSWDCFFQTTLLRIQFRAILLLHWVIWIKKRTVFSHYTRMISLIRHFSGSWVNKTINLRVISLKATMKS